MIAIGVLLVASMGAFSAQLASLNLTKTSRETNTAMGDLQAAMEQVLAEPGRLTVHADFGENTPIPAFTERHLAGEQIVANYPGFTVGDTTDPDPLTIVLTATWADFQGRPRSLQLSSMTTR